MSGYEHEALDAALAALPRELAPGRDLWPGIAAGLGAQARPASRQLARRWPLGLAAGLGVVTLLAALLWQRTPHPGAQALDPYSASRAAAYQAADGAAAALFRERVMRLDAATRKRVEADLNLIRRANADLQSALARDPASPLLQELLRATWQQQFDLYTTVARATDPLYTRRT